MSDLTSVNELKGEDKARFIMDIFKRTIVHYAIWFNEVKHQMGMEKALEVLGKATDRGLDIQMKRLSKILGFELSQHKGGIPKALLELDEKTLDDLLKGSAANWLVNDGVWFQAVEFDDGMNEAKRCNDSAWAQFSPVEAWSIKRFCGLEENCGLEGLKKALGFRIYSCINTQSIEDDGDNAFIFRMNECRVQVSRKRKGLDDYPCKSGGAGRIYIFCQSHR